MSRNGGANRNLTVAHQPPGCWAVMEAKMGPKMIREEELAEQAHEAYHELLKSTRGQEGGERASFLAATGAVLRFAAAAQHEQLEQAQADRESARRMLVEANADYVEQRRARLATEAQVHMTQVRAEAAEQQLEEARAELEAVTNDRDNQMTAREMVEQQLAQACGQLERDRAASDDEVTRLRQQLTRAWEAGAQWARRMNGKPLGTMIAEKPKAVAAYLAERSNAGPD